MEKRGRQLHDGGDGPTTFEPIFCIFAQMRDLPDPRCNVSDVLIGTECCHHRNPRFTGTHDSVPKSCERIAKFHEEKTP